MISSDANPATAADSRSWSRATLPSSLNTGMIREYSSGPASGSASDGVQRDVANSANSPPLRPRFGCYDYNNNQALAGPPVQFQHQQPRSNGRFARPRRIHG